MLQHLKAWVAYRGADVELSYWRTRSGVEVDFVLYGADTFWAVEVKNTRTVRAADVRALYAFVSDYPEAKPLLLHRGEQREVVHGVLCVPVKEFLRGLHPERPFFEME